MSRVYNEIWESAKSPHNNFSHQTEQKYFGQIIVDTDVDTKNDCSYYTVSIKKEPVFEKQLSSRIIKTVTALLSYLVKKHTHIVSPKILCIGLGNEKITPDSLGAKSIDKLTVTSHLYDIPQIRAKHGNLCAYKSSVSGITGIESYDVITALIDSVNPDMVIAIDTLCSSKISRLNKCIQITDDGISPGGGVNNAKQKLSIRSLGIPIIAIGVPLVVYLKSILREHNVKEISENIIDLAVTGKDIDFLIDEYSTIIAESINNAVHHAK